MSGTRRAALSLRHLTVGVILGLAVILGRMLTGECEPQAGTRVPAEVDDAGQERPYPRSTSNRRPTLAKPGVLPDEHTRLERDHEAGQEDELPGQEEWRLIVDQLDPEDPSAWDVELSEMVQETYDPEKQYPPSAALGTRFDRVVALMPAGDRPVDLSWGCDETGTDCRIVGRSSSSQALASLLLSLTDLPAEGAEEYPSADLVYMTTDDKGDKQFVISLYIP